MNIRVKSTDRVVSPVPGFGRLSNSWEEETGESRFLVSRGGERLLGVMQRPLMATWACALGFVTWDEEATRVVILSGSDSLLSRVAKPNMAAHQTRMTDSTGSRAWPSHPGSLSPLLPAVCPAPNLLEMRNEHLRLGPISLSPSPGYFQLGKDDLKRGDGEVIAYPEENPFPARPDTLPHL